MVRSASRPGIDIAFDGVQSITVYIVDGSVVHLATDVTSFVDGSFPTIAREKPAKYIGSTLSGTTEVSKDAPLIAMQLRDVEGGERNGEGGLPALRVAQRGPAEPFPLYCRDDEGV